MSTTSEQPIANPPISTEEQAAADLLSEQDLQLIDTCILSHCDDQFHKVARIIGRTDQALRDRFPKLSYIFYTLRLKRLVDSGRLEAAGDVFKMRFSEVRIPTRSDIDRLITALSSANSFGPVSAELIANAERTLGVTFPGSYKTFLAAFGASLCQGYELAGLFECNDPDRPAMWTDVVTATLRIRRVSRGAIATTLVFVASDGCDDTFYLDTAQQTNDRESPVVAIGPGRNYEVVAHSFVSFVERLSAR